MSLLVTSNPSETEYLSSLWRGTEESLKSLGKVVALFFLDRPHRVLVWHQLELDCFRLLDTLGQV